VSTQASLRLKDVELNEIVRAFDPDGKPVLARLGGEFNGLAEFGRGRSVVGSGRIKLTEGNLANFGPVKVLYDALRVGQTEKRNGSGEIAVGLDAERFDVNRFVYYESGIDMRGVATVYDLRQGKASPVKGALAGTLQPFRDIKLPFMADADDILNAIQQFVTPVAISGTVGDMKSTLVTFDDVADTLRGVFSGGNSGK
jgi:hypothetical protein